MFLDIHFSLSYRKEVAADRTMFNPGQAVLTCSDRAGKHLSILVHEVLERKDHKLIDTYPALLGIASWPQNWA